MKARWKKCLSALMTVMLTASLFVTPAFAAGTTSQPTVYTAETTYINPLYADVMTEEELVHSAPTYNASVSFYGEDYVTTLEETGEYIAEEMKDREASITVRYATTEAYSEDLFTEVFYSGLEHTGEPTEGDYLKWQWGGYSGSVSYYSSDMYYYTFTYTVTYYTTAEQEAAMDTAVADLLVTLNVDDASDYQKLCAIYDYMCSNITYDYDNLDDDSYKLKYTAYAALINKTAVCQGYANLFYRLALELGVDARLITGIGNGGAHAWNIAELNGKYYDLDSTWDASRKQAGYAYEYFLLCDANFEDHTRGDDYTSEEFYAAYPMDENDYDPSTDVHVHIYGDPVIKFGTDEDGEYTLYESETTSAVFTCTGCGETLDGFCEVSIEETKEPSCTEAGLMDVTVDVWYSEDDYDEDPVYTVTYKDIEEEKLDHEEEVIEEVEPTCTESGLTEGSKCSVCGTILVEQEVVPALGHNWDEGVVTTEPTYTAEGEMTYTCQRCGETKTEAIPCKETETLAIVTNPQDFSGEVGEIASFTVTASGTELSYQWQYSSDGKNWYKSGQTGATTDTLKVDITAKRDGQQYRCVVTDVTGQSLISETATLNVTQAAPALVITSQPQDIRCAAGETATFRVVAEGNGLTYQWYYSSNGEKWYKSGLTGATTDTISVPVTVKRNGQQYRCVVTDATGNNLTSDAATLKVGEKEKLNISGQPEDYTGPVGTKATFSVMATGEGLIYQWQYSNNGSKWYNSSQTGSTTDILKVDITAKRDGQQYRCIVSDEDGNTVTSDAAVLHVGGTVTALSITNQPLDYSGEVNSTATFTVSAQGDGLTYQWQYSNNGTKWYNSGQTGSTTDTLSVPITAKRNNQKYRCIVTDQYGQTCTSEVATLIVVTK